MIYIVYTTCICCDCLRTITSKNIFYICKKICIMSSPNLFNSAAAVRPLNPAPITATLLAGMLFPVSVLFSFLVPVSSTSDEFSGLITCRMYWD